MNKRIHTTASSRLKQDYLRIKKDPVPYVTAAPLPTNILEWFREVYHAWPHDFFIVEVLKIFVKKDIYTIGHYVVKGPENTPYEGGFYHGKLIFPKEFPFRPPRILMLTPNGRFKTNTRLCLSISDFHPDTWNPAWSVSTILTGLLSFMVETSPTLGSIETHEYQKKQLAISSGEFNLRHTIFCELFPEICEEIREKQSQLGKNRSNKAELSQSNDSAAAQGEGGGVVGSTVANIVVIIGFAAFAYTVKCVIRAVGSS